MYRTAYRTVDVDRLSVFYREAGLPDAPTVQLLHGFPSSSRIRQPLLDRLADTFHLVAPTIRVGHSDAPATSSSRTPSTIWPPSSAVSPGLPACGVTPWSCRKPAPMADAWMDAGDASRPEQWWPNRLHDPDAISRRATSLAGTASRGLARSPRSCVTTGLARQRDAYPARASSRP